MNLKTASLYKNRKYNVSFSCFAVSILYRYKKHLEEFDNRREKDDYTRRPVMLLIIISMIFQFPTTMW